MRQKLITLDLTSYEIASSMTNFSQWVRNRLKEYRHQDQDELDLGWWMSECERQTALLSDIKAGKKAWNPNLHGWLSCGEEE